MMKKYLMALAVVLCCAAANVLTACTNIDDNPTNADTETEKADYTILYYGFGGETLDKYMLQNMKEMYDAKLNSYDKVKIAAQYKYSSIEDIKENMIDPMVKEGASQEEADAMYDKLKPFELQTIRFVVDNTIKDPIDNVLLNTDNIYGPKNSYMTTVDSLINFINWATEVCPAKKYILILSGHGESYITYMEFPYVKPASTRSLMSDNYKDPRSYFTASSLKYALSHTNSRMDAVYLDACSTNNIEYHFELKDITDYLIMTTTWAPDRGGVYDVLIDHLAQNTADLEPALVNYNKDCVAIWDIDKAEMAEAGITDYELYYHDLSVIRTRDLDAFGNKFKEFVDRLVAAYANKDNKAKIDAVTQNALKVMPGYPSYDIKDYTTAIMTTLPDVFDQGFANELLEKFDNCVASRYCNEVLMKKNIQINCSVMMGVKGSIYVTYFENTDYSQIEIYYNVFADGKVEYYEAGQIEPVESFFIDTTWENTYQQLTFDKVTGWSRWLYLNEQIPNLYYMNDRLINR